MIKTVDTSTQDVLPRYQEWRNYPTWCVALWFGNDEPLYRSALEATREAIESATEDPDADPAIVDRDAAITELAAWIEDQTGELAESGLDLAGMLGDLLTWALAYVDWREIAATWIDDELPA